MRIAIYVLKVLVILLLILDLFFWASLHSTGHNIPHETDKTLFIYAFLLVILLVTLLFFGRKFPRN
jgi:hypothetical protein